MSLNQEKAVTVSSDLGGFFSDPLRVAHLYKMARFNPGMELVLMPFQIHYLEQLARGDDLGFDVTGFHGELGSTQSHKEHEKGLSDWLLIQLFDLLLPTTIDTANSFSRESTLFHIETAAQKMNKPLYYNVHQNAVGRQFEHYLNGVSRICKISTLAIENGPGSKDVEKTKQLIGRLKDGGAHRVEGTFDLVHAVVGLLGGATPDISGVTAKWSTSLGSMDANFTRIHLPIGRKAGDSLPILDMIQERKMLRDLGQIVSERGMSVTLENQHSLLFGVLDTSIEVDRLKRIHDGLQEGGII